MLKIDNKMMSVLSDWYEVSNHITNDDYIFNNHGTTLQVMRPNKWLHDVTNKYGVAVG